MEERKTYFVDVLLPVPIHNTFTYRVPFELNGFLKTGVRVVVPFGKGKLQTGLIVRVHQEVPSGYQSKYVESILDDRPIITGKQYKLWNWVAEYYMAPLGDVMNAALPSNFKLGSETKVILHPEHEVNQEQLTDREFQVFEALEIQEELHLKDISDILGVKNVQPVIKSMIDKRVLITKEELRHKYTPKTQLFVELADAYRNEKALEQLLNEYSADQRKKKQTDALLTLLHLQGGKRKHAVSRKAMEEQGASISSMNTLEKHGILRLVRKQISRLGAEEEDVTPLKDLSADQSAALASIRTDYESKNVVLLHGVTGSGKTEVYVELIKEQIEQGKQVLYLLPEIALTTQLIERLSKYFGDKVGVYHSRFNQNERVEIWNELLNGNGKRFQIILGARSAVFLPFKNLGLIIVDEEHESSFKQYDPSPRYNGRDTAIVLRAFHDAKVLLGSATPALESFYNAKQGKYGLVTLDKRFGDIQMPEIFTADIRKEKKEKTMQSDFSKFLIDHMKAALEREEQIILFQNRRGYNPIWACEVCGWNPNCKNCDVSLTYHKKSNILKCHYCSYFTPPVGSCPECGSNRLKMVGFGTEKIEDELSIILPGVRVQRLDLDTTRQKNSYEKILSDFQDRKIDILVGTQMVTKGLDFDNVSLVGILDADMMLRRPDFRSFERSYQLMSQVAGRAGRKSKRGTVVIQTYDPDHWVIRYVIEHDYQSMYKHELIERENYFYPPFYKMIHITLKHRQSERVEMSTEELAQQLKQVFGSRVLGPESPIVQRIQNQFLKVIRLKVEREASQKNVKQHLRKIINKFYSNSMNKPVRIIIDVDPM